MFKHYASYVLLSIVLVFSACDKEEKQLKKIACIGDSITYGEGMSDRVENCYPAQLEKMLGLSYDVENFGVSGATLIKNGDLSYWNQPEFDSVLVFNPDVIFIMLGSNDSKPWNWKKKEDYKKDYFALIDRFQELSSSPKIYICNPPPVFKTRWGINDSIIRSEIIPLILNIAKKEKIEVIDMYTPFVDKGDCFPDFIHPDSTGASHIALTIANTLTHY